MKADDSALVNKIKQDKCEKSFLELAERHEKIFYKICHRFKAQFEKYGLPFNELLEDKNFIIYQAVLSFDFTKKTKFSTWLANTTRYACLNRINKIKRKFIFTDERELNKKFEELSLFRYFNARIDYSPEKVIELLKPLEDKRIYRIFRMKYSSGKRVTWGSIAQNINTTTQTVLNLHKKGLNYLKKTVTIDTDVYE